MAPIDSEAMAECIAVIRSLLLIRKQLTTLRDINGEYRAMEDENIPYTKFGYLSLEDMLRRSGQFNLTRQTNGQVCAVQYNYFYCPVSYCVCCCANA